MKKTKFFVAIVVAMVAMLSSCSLSEMEQKSKLPEPEKLIPVGFRVVSGSLVDIIMDDDSRREGVDHNFIVSAEDTIKVAGTEPIEPAEPLVREAEDTLRFSYNYDIVNTVIVEGLTIDFEYEGVLYEDLPCLDTLMVEARHAVVKESKTPSYYELSETDYVLSTESGVELAGCTQIFVVEEGYTPPVFDHVDWTTRHYQFQRNAGLENDTISVLCNNFAEFAEVWSDGSRKEEESIPYLVNNTFKFNFPELNENEVKGLNGKSVEFVNGVAKINGHQVSCTWIEANVEGDVVYGNKDYAGEIEPCKVAARTITFGESSATILFYNEDEDDYAKISVNIDGTPVMEDPVYNYTEWSYRHENFQREAQLSSDNTISVFCDNVADFVEVWSDDSRRNAKEVDYTVVNRFQISVPEIQATADDEVVGKTYDFVNGVVTVAGKEISAQRLSAEVEGKVVYMDKDYAGEIKPCVAEAKTITFTSAEKAVIRFYDEDSKDYAEATLIVTVVPYEEPVTVEDVEWSYRHVAFQREAQLSNNTVNVFCNNFADFVQVMSDGSRQNEESVDYTVVNRFQISVPEIVVDDVNEVVGKTYNFTNGVVTVAGREISAQRLSAEVEGKVVYMDKDYAGEIKPCVAEARTISFTSAEKAVIRFYANDSQDYAEIIVDVTVTKKEVTVINAKNSFRHIAFEENATVVNNTISIVCDNEATRTTTWSNGTTSAESVNYTVTNRFVYTLASMPASVKGQSFQFNGSNTVTVEGREVMVNFSAREVSAIMFNGTDYRSEAPVCAVEVSTITFQENGAVIVFTHGNETVSASIPVNYIEAEVIDGKIVGLWITDSYDLYCRYTSTDLHILAEKNGAYVAYSRNVNGKDWTVTDLSAADGQNILSSGRAMAWAQPGRIGTVSAVEASKTSTGYIITYFFPNGSPANIMGDAEAALNGTPFTDPVKATGSAENGMWTISYNGVVNYFVGTNM